MEKLDGMTLNVINENVQKLKELFPEAFKEDKVDFDVLRSVLGDFVSKEKERYEFNWNGKSEAIKMALKQSTATLRPCKEESKNWESTENLYLEGDNLEVLRVLQDSYRGKVKMIYIDPPYNTGHDFVYEDDFSDNIENYKNKTQQNSMANPETNGRFHSDWLNMIYPRLRIARNLLTEDGVIFISIDDNEQSNLKKVCDEIFGEENFIAQMIWKSKPQGGNDNSFLVSEHEYIFLYSKNFSKVSLGGRKLNSDKYKNKDIFFDVRGGYNLAKLDLSVLPYRPNLDYPVKCPDGSFIYPGNVTESEWFDRKNGKNKDHDWRWRWSIDRLENGVKNEYIEFKNNNGKWNLYTKEYEFIDNDGNVINRLAKYRTIIDKITTVDGTRDVVDVFNSRIFSYPKPLDLIKHLLKISNIQDDFILDFFSGSATTSHAVMQLNAEDNGNRKFIMVQLPELTDEKSEAYKAGYKNICEIGKERIRRAGEKIKEENKDKENIDKLDIGFKVFKLDDTNLKQWDEKTKDLSKTMLDIIDPLKSGRTQEDLMYEVLLKYGIDISLPIEEKNILGKKVFSVAGNYLLMCLEKELSLELIEEMAKLKPSRIVFYDEGFKDNNIKINAEQILKKYNIEDIRVI